MLSLFAAVALLIVAIYVVFPKVVGLDGTFDRFDEATWYWIVVAFCMPVLTYYSYAVLVRSVFGQRGPDEIRERLDMKASGLISLSALAASALFSAAGAGGVALQYWALRKAGMGRRRVLCRGSRSWRSSTRSTCSRSCCSGCCWRPRCCPARTTCR